MLLYYHITILLYYYLMNFYITMLLYYYIA